MYRLKSALQSQEGKVAGFQLILSLVGAFIGCMFIRHEIISLVVIIISSISAYGSASLLSKLIMDQPEEK